MIYSCFDPKAGLYDYFADSVQRPINADLPIPKLPAAAGKVGVPAIEAGRPMPADAKHVGRGWHAKGMVVVCGRGAYGAVPSFDSAWTWTKEGGWKWILGGLAAVWLVRRI